jgi:integrase
MRAPSISHRKQAVTVYLDRRFRRIGRIKKAAGTDHKPTIRRLNAMLDGLFNSGRLDVLRGIQKGTYTPLQVYEFYRVNQLENLPTAATMGELEASMKSWIENKECSDAHRRSLHQSLRHIISVAHRTPAIADLPDLLEELRVKMQKAKHPRSFNLAKAAAQAFVKSKLKRNHPLYFAVMGVESLRVVQQRKKTPLLYAQIVQLMNDLCNESGKDVADTVWLMAITGMGPGEAWGDWETTSNSVWIHGTKRTGRNRVVPLLNPRRLHHPTISYRSFREALKASTKDVTPYDMRRTYANWMEGAGIPRTRRKLYMGHGASDVTDLYERHEVQLFLDEDAERLRTFLGATDSPRPKLILEA